MTDPDAYMPREHVAPPLRVVPITPPEPTLSVDQALQEARSYNLTHIFIVGEARDGQLFRQVVGYDNATLHYLLTGSALELHTKGGR